MKRNLKPRTANKAPGFTKKYADNRQKNQTWRKAQRLAWRGTRPEDRVVVENQDRKFVAWFRGFFRGRK